VTVTSPGGRALGLLLQEPLDERQPALHQLRRAWAVSALERGRNLAVEALDDLALGALERLEELLLGLPRPPGFRGDGLPLHRDDTHGLQPTP
jgi:hypothetical protein